LMGDTPDDAQAAEACGLRFVGFAGGYGGARQATEVEADWPCADFTDLLAIVRGETV